MSTVYLHGMPGGPGELDLLGDSSARAFFVAARSGPAGPSMSFDALARAVAERDAGQGVRLVAFSLGARPALELAFRLGAQVSGVDLIAPAAPLTMRDRDMAGYPVFMLARRHPALFGVLVGLQAAMAWSAPALLYAALFRTAQGADSALSRDAAFRAGMLTVLSRCFADGGRAYRAEVAAYVGPWRGLAAQVTQPVTLWHGTLDNWAPIAMSERLFEELPNAVAFHRLEGLSHYSTLRAALRKIDADAAIQGVDHA